MVVCSKGIARLAQSVEHGTLNPRVVGSSPTLGDKVFLTKKVQIAVQIKAIYACRN